MRNRTGVLISGSRPKASGSSSRASSAIKPSVQALARAVLIGSVVTLAIDIVMRTAMQFVAGRIFTETLGERAVGVVFAVLFSATSGFWATRIEAFTRDRDVPHVSRSTALVLVGVGMIAVPILWSVAAWLVVTTTMGRVALSANYLLTIIPSLLGGAALLTWSRHALD